MNRHKEEIKNPIFVGGAVKGPGLTVLWQGDIEIKIVDEFGIDKKAMIRRFCGIEPLNRFIGFGFFILSPINYGIEKCVMDIVFPGNDIFVAFRAMQAMHYMDKLSNKNGRSVLLWRALCRNVPEENRTWLKNMIGEREFQELFSTAIPDLERAVGTLVARGVMLNPVNFQEEIDAGTIQYAEYMRALNIESPEVRKERNEKRAKITAPYRDKVVKCVIPSELAGEAPPEVFEMIDKIIYGSIARGAREEPMIVGVSVGRIMYEAMLAEILMGGKAPVACFMPGNENKVKNIIASRVAEGVAEEFLERFPEIILPEGYTGAVTEFLRNWENMPEVDV